MAGKKQATPKEKRPPTDEELAAADAVRAARQAKRDAKAVAAKAKAAAEKADKNRQADVRRNAFGMAASSAKATSVSRSIISHARGGRGR